MESIQEMYDRIVKIDWFAKCGEKTIININLKYEFVRDWTEAAKKCNDKWDNLKLEIRNELTSSLHENWRDKFREWNNITMEAKELLKVDVLPKMSRFINDNGINKNIYESIEWDLIASMMEYSYSPYTGLGFYTELLKVYESGHIPCGWKGKWPEGNLLIY